MARAEMDPEELLLMVDSKWIHCSSRTGIGHLGHASCLHMCVSDELIWNRREQVEEQNGEGER